MIVWVVFKKMGGRVEEWVGERERGGLSGQWYM